tara:strand:+ start:1553 stop:1846 length:294 start_codon:yes stop_codon:yes gene_type:complete
VNNQQNKIPPSRQQTRQTNKNKQSSHHPHHPTQHKPSAKQKRSSAVGRQADGRQRSSAVGRQYKQIKYLKRKHSEYIIERYTIFSIDPPIYLGLAQG